MLRPDHTQIFSTLQAYVETAGIKYTSYTDNATESIYHCVDGKSIKFWNVFPYSGSKVDEMMYQSNRYLQQFGLMLVFHIFVEHIEKLVPVIVPQQRGPEVRCKGYVNIPKFTLSLLVKPIPERSK